MEVFVKIMKDNSTTEDKVEVAAISYLTFVGLGQDGKPTQVPLVEPETPEEQIVFNDRQVRKQARLKKREETNELIHSLIVPA